MRQRNDVCDNFFGHVFLRKALECQGSPGLGLEASQDVEEIKGAISGAEVHGFDFEGLCTPVASSCGSLQSSPSVLV